MAYITRVPPKNVAQAAVRIQLIFLTSAVAMVAELFLAFTCDPALSASTGTLVGDGVLGTSAGELVTRKPCSL